MHINRSGYNLTHVPVDILNNHSITQLSLDQNQITQLPEK